MSGIFKGRLDPCNDNIGGVTKLYLFTYVDYRRYQIEVDGNTLVSYPATTIYEYELRADGNVLNEDLQTDEEGISYDQSVSGVLKQIGINYFNTSNLLNKKVGCIIKDRLGNLKIIGLYNGCRVPSVNFTTGGSRSDFNGANISISARETKQAFYIDDLASAGFTFPSPSCGLLNLDAANQDRIELTTHMMYSGVFDWEFKFSFSAESSGFAPVFGTNVAQSRIIVSQTTSRVIINLGDNSILMYSYPFTFNTEHVMRLRRDGSNNVYITLDGNSEVFLGVRTGTWGALAAVITYIGRSEARFLTGEMFYANLGGNDDFQLNEGSGATVTSEIGGSTGTIVTTQDLNYINNVMWEPCP